VEAEPSAHPDAPVPAAGEIAAPAVEPFAIPESCAAKAEICALPAGFARALCKRRSADVALAMFKSSSPWTRAYVRRATDAWYTENRLAAPARLELDEEVIIIQSRAGASGGVQIEGMGNYDVYRWDGTCASLMSDEVTFEKPPAPRAATIAWTHLGDDVRQALLRDRAIVRGADLQRNRCRDDRRGAPCATATSALSDRVAAFVRGGGDVPLIPPND
jgi:hypothetical protein